MKKIIYSLFAAGLLMSCGSEAETENTEAPEESTSHEETAAPETTTEETEAIAFPAGWEEVTHEGLTILAVKDSVTNEQMNNFSPILAENYGQIVTYMTGNGIEFAGAPLTRWITWDTTAYSVYAAGIPVAEGTVAGDGLEIITIDGGTAYKYTHVGPYEAMQQAHFDINDYMYSTGNLAIGGPWEVYITDPGTEPDPAKWVSEIWYPMGH